MTLADRLAPCGPIFDAKAAARVREAVGPGCEDAWPALEPVFAASPYLAGLARRRPERLAALLASEPDSALEAVIASTGEAAALPLESGRRRLRELKADLHLLTALADLGGVWDLDQVTGALTRFADASVQAALALLAAQARGEGKLVGEASAASGPIAGLFVIAMGKMGAFELNYSSDIDVSVFYEPEALTLASGVEPSTFASRIAQGLVQTLQDRTADGYVFRVDLRLRPDPSSTPPAVSVPGAMDYYESVGQNWERAAFIKARACAGDIALGLDFLTELQPFIWRRHLDFAAIADIHSIKRQIHVHKVDERLTAAGHDLKLGRGGIREVEFYVQTQQLILGGRHAELRSSRTLDALAALAAAGHVSPQAARDMADGYRTLRALEHRVQMIADEQTARLPEPSADRKRVAALFGEGDLRRFDGFVGRVLKAVNRRYGELFAEEEALSSRFGSLVFTGVEDDPQTLETLGRMGFDNPAQVSATVRSWHHGRIAATRTERGRELFTRLAPRLLEAAHETGAPTTAFNRFADFFAGLSSGVQVQSLFLAQPQLFELIVRVLALAPRLAATLTRRPAALDALLDPAFFAPLEIGREAAALSAQIAATDGFEPAMDLARRIHREQAFRIGVQVISGTADARAAGGAFADLADLIIRGLAPAALAETQRIGGAFPGQVAVVALGKAGSREMSAGSDLDLMMLYEAEAPDAVSETKGWAAETFYTRFSHRLTAALSTPTAEGTLYEVDLQLRPSGTQGPVAVSFAAFEGYYAEKAETWEFLAMTRARVVWATSEAFAARAEAAIEAVLRRPRDRATAAHDVREMRDLMARERPPKGFWDLKLSEGGLVDIEFVAQHLQIVHAGAGGPLRPNTNEALEALAEAGLADAGLLDGLAEAWRLNQDLSQLLKVALAEDAEPTREPAAFRRLLAATGGAKDLAALQARLRRVRKRAHAAYEALVN